MGAAATVSGDVVVIGGGSSGAALAGRAVEAGREVVLVEAGPDYGAFGDPRWPSELLDARALALTHDWGFTSGRWTFERARVIGGCSSHNGAIAAVGHRRDYDAWGLTWLVGRRRRAAVRAGRRADARARLCAQRGGPVPRALSRRRRRRWAGRWPPTCATSMRTTHSGSKRSMSSAPRGGTPRSRTSIRFAARPCSGSSTRQRSIASKRRRVECACSRPVAASPLELVAGTLVLSAGVYGTPGDPPAIGHR